MIESGNHPLDLPPVAKALDVAGVAATAGTRRCFEQRTLSELLDQLRGVVQRTSAVDIGKVHIRLLTSEAVVGSRIDTVNGRFTTRFGWRGTLASAKAAPWS